MILLDNVTKTYPRSTHPALDGVSVEIERGEFVFVVGQSGSGKSTLLRLILREDVATSGSVLVAGRELRTLPERKVPLLRRGIGTVFQDFRLLPNKNVHQNVAFALQVIGRSRTAIRQTVPETLEIVGLEGKAKRMPHQLSGGEQQRVAIARAIVNKPAILLADEPTGNLDPATSGDIVRLLDRINRSGTTVVMATHDHEIVDELRKRVVELDRGRLVRDQVQGEYGHTTSAMPAIRVEDELDEQLQRALRASEADEAAARLALASGPFRMLRRRRSATPSGAPVASPRHTGSSSADDPRQGSRQAGDPRQGSRQAGDPRQGDDRRQASTAGSSGGRR
ncbi:MAG: cell division ATP-binding protein FtsE [Dermatophilaceae bacterium]